MNIALKYLKLDLTMLKGYIKLYLMFPLLIVLLTFISTPSFALNYLFFLVIVLSTTPFSLESSEKTNRLLYMLPGKRNSMVLGRYLYLSVIAMAVWAVDAIGVAIYYPLGKISTFEIGSLMVSAAIGSLLCLMQYPIYYKFGYEKGRLSTTLIYMVPGLLIVFIPIISKHLLQVVDINSIILFISTYWGLLIAALVLVILLAGYVSYQLSCMICRGKEI